MAIVVAVILALVAVGSVLFHFLSPWWWTPIASNWGGIDDTIIITFWITGQRPWEKKSNPIENTKTLTNKNSQNNGSND